jgi:predicted aldo/keto reductase-like oxidoreductase
MPVNAECELRLADAPPVGTMVPKRRFGRTELQMPILTCGGMRAQYKWGPDAGMQIGGEITKECQQNFDAIAERALSYGINHFETARGYGCSEIQFCATLRRLCSSGSEEAGRTAVDRKDIIVQTKVPPCADPEEFRTKLQLSFDTLQPPGGYIDLFGFHGVNTEKQLAWIRDGCYAVAKEFQEEGKIKHIGFSTHGMTQTIVNAIETDLFDYVNLHYHFIGSNTSTGTGASSISGRAGLRLCGWGWGRAEAQSATWLTPAFVHRRDRRVLLEQARRRVGGEARHGCLHHLAV